MHPFATSRSSVGSRDGRGPLERGLGWLVPWLKFTIASARAPAEAFAQLKHFTSASAGQWRLLGAQGGFTLRGTTAWNATRVIVSGRIEATAPGSVITAAVRLPALAYLVVGVGTVGLTGMAISAWLDGEHSGSFYAAACCASDTHATRDAALSVGGHSGIWGSVQGRVTSCVRCGAGPLPFMQLQRLFWAAWSRLVLA